MSANPLPVAPQPQVLHGGVDFSPYATFQDVIDKNIDNPDFQKHKAEVANAYLDQKAAKQLNQLEPVDQVKYRADFLKQYNLLGNPSTFDAIAKPATDAIDAAASAGTFGLYNANKDALFSALSGGRAKSKEQLDVALANARVKHGEDPSAFLNPNLVSQTVGSALGGLGSVAAAPGGILTKIGLSSGGSNAGEVIAGRQNPLQAAISTAIDLAGGKFIGGSANRLKNAAIQGAFGAGAGAANSVIGDLTNHRQVNLGNALHEALIGGASGAGMGAAIKGGHHQQAKAEDWRPVGLKQVFAAQPDVKTEAAQAQTIKASAIKTALRQQPRVSNAYELGKARTDAHQAFKLTAEKRGSATQKLNTYNRMVQTIQSALGNKGLSDTHRQVLHENLQKYKALRQGVTDVQQTRKTTKTEIAQGKRNQIKAERKALSEQAAEKRKQHQEYEREYKKLVQVEEKARKDHAANVKKLEAQKNAQAIKDAQALEKARREQSTRESKRLREDIKARHKEARDIERSQSAKDRELLGHDKKEYNRIAKEEADRKKALETLEKKKGQQAVKDANAADKAERQKRDKELKRLRDDIIGRHQGILDEERRQIADDKAEARKLAEKATEQDRAAKVKEAEAQKIKDLKAQQTVRDEAARQRAETEKTKREFTKLKADIQERSKAIQSEQKALDKTKAEAGYNKPLTEAQKKANNDIIDRAIAEGKPIKYPYIAENAGSRESSTFLDKHDLVVERGTNKKGEDFIKVVNENGQATTRLLDSEDGSRIAGEVSLSNEKFPYSHDRQGIYKKTGEAGAFRVLDEHGNVVEQTGEKLTKHSDVEAAISKTKQAIGKLLDTNSKSGTVRDIMGRGQAADEYVNASEQLDPADFKRAHDDVKTEDLEKIGEDQGC